MAGRAGRSGGARVGAGRKPGTAAPPLIIRSKKYQTGDADEFLRAAMQDHRLPLPYRMRAALALQESDRPEVLGKKARAQQNAWDLVRRNLAPLPAPTKARRHLRVVK